MLKKIILKSFFLVIALLMTVSFQQSVYACGPGQQECGGTCISSKDTCTVCILEGKCNPLHANWFESGKTSTNENAEINETSFFDEVFVSVNWTSFFDSLPSCGGH